MEMLSGLDVLLSISFVTSVDVKYFSYDIPYFLGGVNVSSSSDNTKLKLSILFISNFSFLLCGPSVVDVLLS